MEKNKKKIVLIVCLALLVVGLIAGTYAWLRLTLTGTKTNIIRAGSLSLTLDDKASTGINLVDAYPMKDIEGQETRAYTFTLKNEGTMASNYTIYLDDLASIMIDEVETEIEDGTRMSDSNIKYELIATKKEEEKKGPAILETIGTNPERVLDSGTITAGEEYEYQLRLWIDEEATNEEIANKIFAGQIRVEAEQANQTEVSTACKVTSGDGTQKGDEITCGTESFYVVSNDGTNIKMLSKYNITVGNNWTDAGYGNFSETALNEVNTMQNQECGTKSYKGTSYYSTCTVSASQTINTEFLNKYLTYLTSDEIGLQDTTTVALPTYGDIESLGCSTTSCTSAPSWVYSTAYWLDYYFTDDITVPYGVRVDGSVLTATDPFSYGYRPVVTISVNEI